VKVKILKEEGYGEALIGIGLSYGVSDMVRLKEVANNLAHKDGGENKFLESMCVWLDIDAPRFWWQQFDTYRVGISKQSSSTMHTMMKRELCQGDFEAGIDQSFLDGLNQMIRDKDFGKLKRHLPEGFLQRRIVCTNYKQIRNMFNQRKKHKLREWQMFIEALVYLQHPEYVFGKDFNPCL